MRPGARAAGDPVGELFDGWALSGRADLMEAEHKPNVVRFLGSVGFARPFSFLDVGCGNGWVVRMVSAHRNCRRAVGIDKSANMIAKARGASPDPGDGNISFVQADVESWRSRARFDYAFSMESLYYAGSVEAALGRVYRLLRPGGRFFCGTDFYADNKATARWAGDMKVGMHLYSRREWGRLFRDAGFVTRTTCVRDPKSRKKWKREWGTLFITGVRPAKG